ncbi:uncharacterized protein ChaoS9_380 [Halobacterium phage ChaoS9]|uniref:Uncharacterized protein n=1 Tax=Halobacterium phage ChaoS9 TaxID=2847105 RepID=A0A481V700_9CAUD|nr:uncharacterized protein KMC41_gp77 [Halobacterium phage ChaoS9]QBI90081.1 uncharacterized protein ChaoS9_380 [Halobacterium phage ChaoS9]
MRSCDHFLPGGCPFKYPGYKLVRQQEMSTEDTRRWRAWKPEAGGTTSGFSTRRIKPTGHRERRRCPPRTPRNAPRRVAARFTGPVAVTTVIGPNPPTTPRALGASPVMSR